MTAVCSEFEFLIARARREEKPELAAQLEKAYSKYLDEHTR